MPFSSINWYIIILNCWGRVQLLPLCHTHHFNTRSTGSAQYKSHAFPLRGDTVLNFQIHLLLPTPILISAAAPCLLAAPGSCMPLAPDGKGATSGTRGHFPVPVCFPRGDSWPRLRLGHFGPNWTVQRTAFTGGCAYRLGIPSPRCAESMWMCEKGKK